MFRQSIYPIDKIRARSEVEGKEGTPFGILSNWRIWIELRTQSDPSVNALISRNPSDRPLHALDLLSETYFFRGKHVQCPDGNPSLVVHVEIAQSQPCRSAEARERRLIPIAARNELDNQIPLPTPKPEDRKGGVMNQPISARLFRAEAERRSRNHLDTHDMDTGDGERDETEFLPCPELPSPKVVKHPASLQKFLPCCPDPPVAHIVLENIARANSGNSPCDHRLLQFVRDATAEFLVMRNVIQPWTLLPVLTSPFACDMAALLGE